MSPALPARRALSRVQAQPKPQTVLDDAMPMLSDILVKSGSTLADEFHEIVLWRVGLDVVLPIMALWLLYKLIDASANRAQAVGPLA